MAEDFDALVADLTTNPLYDAAVVSGNNGEVTRLLNEIEPLVPGPGNKTVIIDVPRRIALKAFKDAVRTLTQLEMDRLKLVMGESEEIATSETDIRAEIVDIFGGASAAVTRLTAAATRDATYGDAFGYSRVSLDTVRLAIQQIDKSHAITHQTAMAPITEARTQRLVDAELDVATTPDNMAAKSNV